MTEIARRNSATPPTGKLLKIAFSFGRRGEMRSLAQHVAARVAPRARQPPTQARNSKAANFRFGVNMMLIFAFEPKKWNRSAIPTQGLRRPCPDPGFDFGGSPGYEAESTLRTHARMESTAQGLRTYARTLTHARFCLHLALTRTNASRMIGVSSSIKKFPLIAQMRQSALGNSA